MNLTEKIMTEDKNFKANGHSFKIAQLGDVSYSVLCLDPAFDGDGMDNTRWPTDKEVSEVAGVKVECFGGGDDPEYPEGIYIPVEDE